MHVFKKLVNNENIYPGKHVVIYKTPKIKTPKEIHKHVLKGLSENKNKIKLNHVKI